MKTKFCGYCGKELEESWNACPNCGNILSNLTNQKKPTVNPFKIRFLDPIKQQYMRTLRSTINVKKDILGYLSLLFGILSSTFGFVIGVFTG